MSEPANPQPAPPAATPRVGYHPMLSGQKALVTGASSGIGRAVALGMAGAGAEVAVNYRSEEDEAREIVAAIEAAGGRAVAVRADVSDEGQVVAMFGRALDALGRLDILVANAGLQRDAPIEGMTLDQWNTVIAVNLTGQFLCCREAIRLFRRQGVVEGVSVAAGKIICMSSVHDLIPWAGHVNYAASKGGVLLMMRSIAQEVAPYRIRVNGISPGAIRTPINRSAWETPEARAELLRLIPYGRTGEPDDIARAAVWLASDHADYVVGTTLYVDGGMTLYPEFARGG
ncbi:MAG TPA: SDR family oxidoreductase [Geminicoccaceae bacterium]|nr:SDR family oxidoreductase [Geminicoccaceae bacterium]